MKKHYDPPCNCVMGLYMHLTVFMEMIRHRLRILEHTLIPKRKPLANRIKGRTINVYSYNVAKSKNINPPKTYKAGLSTRG